MATLEVQEEVQVIFSGMGDDDASKIDYYGQMSNQTPQIVTITTQGVYVPMNITGTFDTVNSEGTSAPTVGTFGVKNISNKRLRFLVIATADVEIGNNRKVGWKLAVNGIVLPETTCTATTGTVNFAKVMTQWIVQLDTNDEVTCFLANLTNTQNIQVDRSKIVAIKV
jgi:hypothetical protein